MFFSFPGFALIQTFLFSKIYIPENTQVMKQKNNFNKRGDKRGFKVPAKIKYDSSSMKAGLSNFSSAAGGNNFFGKTLLEKLVPFYKWKFSPPLKRVYLFFSDCK
jgi:hypothetical protein